MGRTFRGLWIRIAAAETTVEFPQFRNRQTSGANNEPDAAFAIGKLKFPGDLWPNFSERESGSGMDSGKAPRNVLELMARNRSLSNFNPESANIAFRLDLCISFVYIYWVVTLKINTPAQIGQELDRQT
jgi:hypothetical protein